MELESASGPASRRRPGSLTGFSKAQANLEDLHRTHTNALAARDKVRTALAAEKTSRDADHAAWRRQVTTAQAATKAAELKSQEIATHAQTFHDAMAADNAGLRAYIADLRLRAGSHPAASAASTDHLGAAIHDEAADGAVMAADEADLVACDRAYVYAAAAYEWVNRLRVEGLAAAP